MISFLPELPAPPLSSLPLVPQAAGGTGSPLDFAELLEAAMPAETPLPPIPVGPRALTDPAPDAAPEAEINPAVAPLPGGTILLQTGEPLPLAPLAPLPLSTPASETPDTIAMPAEEDAEESIAPEHAAPEPAAAVLPMIPLALVLAPTPGAAPPPTPPPAAPALSPLLPAAPLAARVTLAPRAPVPHSPLPLASISEGASAIAEPVSEAVSAGVSATRLPDLADAAPSAATPSQQATAPAMPPTTLAPPVPAERAEMRSPAPNQESTIAQVGEIREALRSVRPEMTMRHAEFGLVSLRIEGAASQDPRAVLASRDPGFIPAVQAALAERAVGAAADTANTGSQTGSGAPSDQRSYGFSQGSGQGSSQPYLEQSGKRDEGASQHQRQQQRRADEAASAGAAEAAPGDAREHGLFA